MYYLNPAVKLYVLFTSVKYVINKKIIKTWDDNYLFLFIVWNCLKFTAGTSETVKTVLVA